MEFDGVKVTYQGRRMVQGIKCGVWYLTDGISESEAEVDLALLSVDTTERDAQLAEEFKPYVECVKQHTLAEPTS